jgi:hypothetical protein
LKAILPPTKVARRKMSPQEIKQKLDDIEAEMEWRFERETKYPGEFECSSTVEACIRDLFEYVKLLRENVKFTERL